MIKKTIASLSFAFAILGGATLLAPSESQAAGRYIYYYAMKPNNGQCPSGTYRSGSQCIKKVVTPYRRSCTAVTRCARG